MDVEIGILMGSTSDWPTMQVASNILDDFNVNFETKIVSAHRTPDLLTEYAKAAYHRHIRVIIAGAGGAAHLPGMLASHTTIPVLGVPIQSKSLNGLDSLLSIVQMPQGVPVGTLAIGQAGAKNAAFLALQIIGLSRPEIQEALQLYRKQQTEKVLSQPDPRKLSCHTSVS